ncbi:glycoside hydrolase family 16 protein [Anaerosporobacter faecicola]|uniref:glycoside hydrolase family 16 protein n=1 Tax=Anaerosporobacter faecicola TaxID=2718714 RepID=UPI00143942C4|nr:glycoside hydrolase family 16 protein [Anaerosporobacter faecicola]
MKKNEIESYRKIIDDDFEGTKLDTSKWLPMYLPQWSSREKSKPSYRVKDSILTLYISDNQEAWCPKWNGEVRVSNLQTGVFSGEIGSSIGQHHFTKELVVTEKQLCEFTAVFQYGYLELKARCHISSENVAALWLIGVEVEPTQSSEICLFELKGWNVKEKSAIIGYGVHPFGDPQIMDEFYEDAFSIDVKDWNVYALRWDSDRITFYLNGEEIRTIRQSPDYAMQIMLNLYDLKGINNEKNTFEIDYVRMYQKADSILETP